MGTSGVEHPGWRRSAQEWFGAHLDDPQVCIVVVEVVAGWCRGDGSDTGRRPVSGLSLRR